jgi:hypothetical protein
VGPGRGGDRECVREYQRKVRIAAIALWADLLRDAEIDLEDLMSHTTDFRQSGFLISPLPLEDFSPLFRLSDAELRSRGMKRVVADSKPGFPCRVSLDDAEVGEALILLPYEHHPVPGPYRSSGPIFVRENATPAVLRVNEVPEYVRERYLSVRAYDDNGMMVRAEVTRGKDLADCVSKLFAVDRTRYLHVHNARPGCYAFRVDRA